MLKKKKKFDKKFIIKLNNYEDEIFLINIIEDETNIVFAIINFIKNFVINITRSFKKL